MEELFKKVNIVFSIALIITALLILFSNIGITSETINGTGEKLSKIKILIDPGHGGIDQGASGSLHIGEAPINLEISKKLMTFLEGSGFEVEMTRYDDTGLYSSASDTIRDKKNEDLKNRVSTINKSNADIVVSIHLNAFPQKQYYGSHVFYQKNNEYGKTAAFILQDSMKTILDPDNQRVPQIKQDIKIMDDTKNTVLLIECGFLSNPAEEQKLVSDEYQEKTAWAIYTGLMKYFNEI
ncbi:MAG: N-acetylmuramoyl-L-alanine amidase [Sedimentibacter saalensis]|jgi:N-acetylmuramoyl-L-alanine amidase|nr:N-acetylmuramoyl-L-alanine amidase [Sedimentibacter saalensis]MEA5096143.1 N-acetylmuramoyl-L-alanine amidase [Sedimentibacter saalensis]